MIPEHFNLILINFKWNMPKAPGKMHVYDMVKIDTTVFEIVGGLLKPPPRIVSCLK